jgi:hypothetical protein
MCWAALRATAAVAALITVVIVVGLAGGPWTGLDGNAGVESSAAARVIWHPTYGMPWFDNAHRLMLQLYVGNHAVPIVRFTALTWELVERGTLHAHTDSPAATQRGVLTGVVVHLVGAVEQVDGR